MKNLNNIITTTILLALGLFALSSIAHAVSPPPDGAYAGSNTAEGQSALFSLTTGIHNTALGFQALFSNTIGNVNTATGSEALLGNTTGFRNTATGFSALSSNTTGFQNTATGCLALSSNTVGPDNTANGEAALFSNTIGSENTANGSGALFSNTTGFSNTATGVIALAANTTGARNTADGLGAMGGGFPPGQNTGTDNTAVGYSALPVNETGSDNTAIGVSALLQNTAGSNNTALGGGAGAGLTTGSNNIDIGNFGVAGESNTIRVGTTGTQTNAYVAGISGVNEGGTISAVYINTDGQLGTQPPASSRRYKKDIKPMDKVSEAILELRPVTFQYKSDNKGVAQFGLIAEEVAKVNPALVLPDQEGRPYTVRYEAVNAMLLNEFLKEHKKVEQLQVTLAQQQKDFQTAIASLKQTVTAQLGEQAAQIQKVSAQLELSKPVSQTIANNQ